ncbi:MAG: penicillin-binding protein 2 [Spirochaetaceae bacterium]|nr:MAG: penicillin-binding protein 2 [Spirochaetaceae bacterium]
MSIQKQQHIDSKRLLILASMTAAVFVLYSWRFFQMQVLEGYIYQDRAQETAQRSEPVFAQRGQIFDRFYDEPLATNRNSFTITVIPADLPQGRQEEVITAVAELFNRDPAFVLDRYRTTARGRFQPVEIVGNLSLREITALAENIQSFPGVSWYSKPERVYPFGELTANLVGYVGDITTQELQVLFNEGYTATAVIGKIGAEQQYDQVLRGTDGRRFRLFDAQGRRVGDDERIIPPVQGSNLVLTIDRSLQKLAQEALGPRIGSVVVMRPYNGEILAMVTYPRFDPNRFIGPGSSVEVQRLSRDQRSPFLNRPVQSSASPASTFKIVMSTAVLEEKAFPVEEEINCTGQFPYGNRVFNDWLEYGHGPVNLASALAQSCNIYYYTMGTSRLTVDQIIDHSYRLGLGSPTGIDISGESSGLVPSPAWKEQFRNARWVGGDTVNLSIGQGFLQVTPLQMAVMVSTIVNNGITYRPHILRETRDPVTGNVITRTQPEVIRDAELSGGTLRDIRAHMRKVITDGTARVVITTNSVDVAGKTGTGQIGVEEHYHSWFVAYAPHGENVPVEDTIAVVVMVDAVNEWEWWAPKAANIIIHGYFRGLDYEETVIDLRRGPRPLWYM